MVPKTRPADPCYHRRCDDLGNLDLTVLDQMADTAAHALATFARDPAPVDRARGEGPSPSPPGSFSAADLILMGPSLPEKEASCG